MHADLFVVFAAILSACDGSPDPTPDPDSGRLDAPLAPPTDDGGSGPVDSTRPDRGPPLPGAITFDDACTLPTTINCWGFESDSDMYYTWREDSSCDEDPFLRRHPNGNNPYGLDRQGSLGNTSAITLNWDPRGECVYPMRDAAHVASGSSSLRFRYHPERNFSKIGKAMMPINQDAVVQHIGLMGELTMVNPLHQVKIFDSNPAA